jgi:hypothetical protein
MECRRRVLNQCVQQALTGSRSSTVGSGPSRRTHSALLDVGHDQRIWRSSSAAAKSADAVLRISFARRSSAFSPSQPLEFLRLRRGATPATAVGSDLYDEEGVADPDAEQCPAEVTSDEDGKCLSLVGQRYRCVRDAGHPADSWPDRHIGARSDGESSTPRPMWRSCQPGSWRPSERTDPGSGRSEREAAALSPRPRCRQGRARRPHATTGDSGPCS